MRAWAAVLAIGLCGGCLRPTSFTCATNAECAGGTCEDVGFCSFSDSACAGGNRFGEFSGPFAGQCVGESGIDAGADATDATLDAAAACTSYLTLPDAPHRYRSIATNASWFSQRTSCAADGGYLAIPDDLVELTAITTLAGTSPSWVGLTDDATEGTFVTVLGAVATFLPWDTGEPNDTPGAADCVRASPAHQLADDRCTTARAAICECEPP